MPMTKTELHRLVDALPDESLTPRRFCCDVPKTSSLPNWMLLPMTTRS